MSFNILNIKIPSCDQLGFRVSGDHASYMRVKGLKPGPALNAGLQMDDIILRINGLEITSEVVLRDSLKLNKRYVTLQIMRTHSNTESEGLRNRRRRHSVDAKSLHESLVMNAGYRVAREIDRTSTGIKLKDKVKFFETKIDEKKPIPLNRFDGRYKSHNLIAPSVKPRKKSNPESQLKSNTLQPNYNNRYQFKSELNLTSDKINNDKSTKLPTNPISTFSPLTTTTNQSRKNNSNFRFLSNNTIIINNENNNNNNNLSKSVQCLSQLNDIIPDSPIRSSLLLHNTNTNSSSSLFDFNPSNIDSEETSPNLTMKQSNNINIEHGHGVAMSDYQIQWCGVYQKISGITITQIENVLINYFKSKNKNDLLNEYPVNFMHLYVTYDDSMKLLYENLLPTSIRVNEDDINGLLNQFFVTSEPNKEINKKELESLIRSNYRVLNETEKKLRVENTQLKSTKEQLKHDLFPYLINQTHKERMEKQVDRLFTMLTRLGSLSITLVNGLSMKILYNDSGSTQKIDNEINNEAVEPIKISIDEEWFCILNQFKRIQSSLENNFIHFFSRFRNNSSTEVNLLFDKVYSEVLNSAICLPVLEEKLKRDEEILKFLDSENYQENYKDKLSFKLR